MTQNNYLRWWCLENLKNKTCVFQIHLFRIQTLPLEKVRTILIVNIFLWFEVTVFLFQIQKISPSQNDVPFDTLHVLALSIKTTESLFVIANFLGATKSVRQNRLTINQLKFY